MELIRPDWNILPQVQVATTTRLGGISKPPYDSLNLGDHVDDHPAAVIENRERMLSALGVERAQWLTQVHGVRCVEAQADGRVREADACWTDEENLACIVMTADCLPVVMTDGERVLAAHAGWRGLANGVLEASLSYFHNKQNLHVWLGPAIGPLAFEVGEEVRERFCDHNPQATECFLPALHHGKWLADLYELARLRLFEQGVQHVSGGDLCTFSDKRRFFSYRRDIHTGRMATVIWKPPLNK